MGTTNLHIEEEYKELIKSIMKSEGFAGSPYKDILGFLTFGYGSKFPISPKEGQMILEHRLLRKIAELRYKKPMVKDLPKPIKEVLFEMCYQLGVNGVLKFKNMFKAIEDKNYDMMIIQMKDSKWNKQTPNRVKKLTKKVRKYINDNR